MVRCNQAVEIHCAQLNLIAYRFTQPRTTRVKSLGNHLHWKGAKKLLVGHRGNSKLLLHTNHAHPHGATKIERFTASDVENGHPDESGRLPIAALDEARPALLKRYQYRMQ